MDRNLGFGHKGYGLTVWDKNSEKGGDYEAVAHIDPHREVHYWVDNLEQPDKDQIEKVARICNMNVSESSSEKVFVTPPQLPHYVVLENAGMDDEKVVFDDPEFAAADLFKDSNYTPDEIHQLSVDIALQNPDGSITTEF